MKQSIAEGIQSLGDQLRGEFNEGLLGVKGEIEKKVYLNKLDIEEIKE